MTEFAFLSTDLENDLENVEEHTNRAMTCVPTMKTDISGFDHIVESKKVKITEVECGKETVEICQKTVNPNNRVSSENFKIQRVIGKGGYGKVFLVQKVDGMDKGKLYAMKVLKKARLVCNEKDKAHTVSERNILEMLRHPFLVKLHYAFQNHSNLYIVLEYCPGGELFNYLEQEGALMENSACFYTSEIILAIGHLHSLGIIYRDLKSENVLLDRQGHVKLTDFGLSKEGACTTNTFCGTIEYMAPEIIKCEGHGKAVDWWSLGTLLFDMLSGGPPFSQEESREATTRKILTAPLKIPPSFSPEVTSLIRGLLKRDPKERLGSKEDVEEIKRHKFFRRHEINWSDVYYRRLKPPFKPKLTSDNDVSMFDPTFTRLQPVVSPPDGSRSIPPDMFQGFSYVAPSVCEDTMRDAWAESNAASHRRHNGMRGAPSTGRLRRLGMTPTIWSGKPLEIQPNRTIQNQINYPDPIEVGMETDISSERRPKQNNEFSEFDGHTQPDIAMSEQIQFDGVADLNEDSSSQPLPTLGDSSITLDIAPTSPEVGHEAAGDTEVEEEQVDEEEDEVEEENVPGAKQINLSPESPYFAPVTKNNFTASDVISNNVQTGVAANLTCAINHSQARPQITSPYGYRSTVNAYSVRAHHEPLAFGYTTAVSSATNSHGNYVTSYGLANYSSGARGIASTTSGHRRAVGQPGGICQPMVVSTPGLVPGASAQPTGSSNSKCCIM
ncbi:unnamed protein product [Calicophoron daubneyi]|uniref:non-specific serine/threonine protein kinase n=1 Tax=Calicophoron daubneyi TaxID=300641 RepID=A0AAV2TN77_CALDB